MFRRILIAILFAVQLVAAGPAMAACTAGSSSGFSSGSAIVGNQVVLCANSSASANNSATKTTSTKTIVNTPKQVAQPKPVCPTTVATTEQIVAAALLGCPIPGPSKPPVAVVVAKPKVTTTNSAAISVASDSAAFTPNPLAIKSSLLVLAIGQSAILTSDAVSHERSAVILGRVGYVKFEPSEYRWSADSGWSASGAASVVNFATAGGKLVSLEVGYLASYRFSLTEVWQSVGTVLVHAELPLEVQATAPPPATHLVGHLVWGSCKVHPSTYRC
jgi:hypothetical protein